jgi:hypothetical protein
MKSKLQKYKEHIHFVDILKQHLLIESKGKDEYITHITYPFTS